ncbi:type I-E CRISPR-associated protein Cse1/CasA [Amycolatopsis sp. NPDC059021]|uniref:type I-E CRISPR-associated protein Cse1/CasA n=1 Tax=Amycolatopsis sp. NPDC059021 TaxID=3346704 RepID=UPI00366E4212
MIPSFDVSAEPWLPVVGFDHALEQVSLREVLSRAHRIRRIAGETPPMTAALYRLVLALFHRVYGPERRQDWGALWTLETFDTAPLTAYFDANAKQLDLFDSERPFLQCPELPAERKASVAKLIPHRSVGNNVTLFDHTTAEDRVELTPAEAARWLVTAQAFDPGGMKTPYLKEKNSVRAPCSGLGVVLVEGATLKETLLLNAVRYAPDAEKPPLTTAEDAPAWEREPPSPHPGSRNALGWTDLLTWPARRIRLLPEIADGVPVVAEAVLTPGERLIDELPDVELMAAYRTPVGANGKPKPGAPMLPLRLHPVRGIWRHSVELLLEDSWAEERTRQRPRALKQIAELVEHEHIPPDTLYTLRVFGQQLDAKSSVVEGYLEEEVLAPVALVRATDEALAGLIGSAIQLADEAGAALRSLQGEYHKSLRARPDVTLDLAYWPALPQPFAIFLREVNDARLKGLPEARAAATWKREVTLIAERAAEDWAAGVAAGDRNLSMLGKEHAAFRLRLARIARTFDAHTAKYLTKGPNR